MRKRESERDPAAAGLTINQKQLQIEAGTSKKNQQETVRKTTSDKSEEKRRVECSGEERRGKKSRQLVAHPIHHGDHNELRPRDEPTGHRLRDQAQATQRQKVSALHAPAKCVCLYVYVCAGECVLLVNRLQSKPNQIVLSLVCHMRRHQSAAC